jgi:hypothetical protein
MEIGEVPYFIQGYQENFIILLKPLENLYYLYKTLIFFVLQSLIIKEDYQIFFSNLNYN